ncbi:hypothetical protein M9Y10_012741 [Tritrichomonas musculus]|uniref:Tc1-like transposase DDE domain-containing protein n=1 Tax=Tritrichomonas musculus TaxID=1915356 RepID=A0ABR2IE90_9EUKA
MLSNLYLLCCIAHNAVFLYHLTETHINTQILNAFFHNLVSNIKEIEYGQFLLIDNASFHSIEDFIIDNMKQKFGITRTPPLGCLFNPIEEFFSCFDDILRKN